MNKLLFLQSKQLQRKQEEKQLRAPKNEDYLERGVSSQSSANELSLNMARSTDGRTDGRTHDLKDVCTRQTHERTHSHTLQSYRNESTLLYQHIDQNCKTTVVFKGYHKIT